MDLEEFENIDEGQEPQALPSFSAEQALDFLDKTWYTRISRRSRWMDLLGDYAGSEPFLIDGDALLQVILDDPLLSISRKDDPSFQILHALHSLERMLGEFLNRSAVFEVVFFEENRHLTLHTGCSGWTVASRTLARRLLFKHLLKLSIPVHTFESTTDQDWKKFERTYKPMFVMTNDGGLSTNDHLSAERVLEQRLFLLELLSQGIAVTSLKGSEFRDSKILSFVFEARLDSDAKKQLPSEFWAASSAARKVLSAEECRIRLTAQIMPLAVHDTRADTAESCLVALARSIAPISPQNATLLYVFVAHVLILEGLSVQDRARSLEPLHPTLLDSLMSSFLPKTFFALDYILSLSDRSIDIDGRIFVSLLCYLISKSGNRSSVSDMVGTVVSVRVNSIWTQLGSPKVDFLRFASLPPARPSVKKDNTTPVNSFWLLPFGNDLFDAELKSIHVSVNDQVDETLSTHMDFGNGTIFSDTVHWHNTTKAILPSHLGGQDHQPLDERQRRRMLKSDQRFMATLQRQAGTLTGASGGILQQIVIVPTETQKQSRGHSAVKEKPTIKQKGKKGKPESSADRLRREIASKKQVDQDNSSQVWWRDQIKTMKKMSTSKQADHLARLFRNQRCKDDDLLANEMQLFQLDLKFREWILESEADSGAVHDKYSISVMRQVKEIYDRKNITTTVSSILSNILIALGFSDYIQIFEDNSPSITTPDRPLAFEFTKLVKSKSKSPIYKFMRIKEHPIEWQLRLFGEFMDRSMDSQPDPKKRVAFAPDAWQCKVLDCIDEPEGTSLLVVAPTSAGKTFISYYAMEKVLRNSNDGILVYVAPTKALVTQIAAEVYARFSKDLNGRSCWAVHTRDWRIHDPQKCQILVTVPEMLSIMLLSPPLAKVWTPRIKRIILDEIHSIGQQEGGSVWEHIILLAPCPIIGLSATIGSPETFNKWLQSVQEAHGFKHEFILHPHRYSHLRKFTYALQVAHKRPFKGLDSWTHTQRLRFLHPISVLSFGVQSLPSDLTLEASDTLSLYQAFAQTEAILPSIDLESLEPKKFFSGCGLLKQSDIIQYEAALKQRLTTLISSCNPRDSASPLSRIVKTLQDPILSQIPEKLLNTVPLRLHFRKNLIYLISDLHVSDDLPAILFNFDRTDCEIMARDLLEALESAEERWREMSAEWKDIIKKWENWKRGVKERERQAERMKKQKTDTDMEPMDAVDLSWEASFDPDAPSPQFSFAGIRTSYSKDDLAKDTLELSRWTSVPDWALLALRRGIAVHHAGMNKRYRTLVESLFRLGFVRVVIATGTLALGINAPTKTSVFCGDSPYLTALMYRQCAGRAGRRGFDLLGKVVFYGLPMSRVQRLVMSKLPSLTGNFPLTPTLILRLFNLLDGSGYAEAAVGAISSLLQLPQISVSSKAGKQQLLHHVRFSIDLLRRTRLLDRQGRPMNLSGIASRLYYTEPSNLALVALLRTGVVHRICNQSSLIQAKEELVLLLSHLFNRRYLPTSYASDVNRALLTKESPSMVVLPPLPADARKVLMKQDKEILQVFMGYAMAYTNQYSAQLGSDSVLPFSKLEFTSQGPDIGSPFIKHLQDTAIHVLTRSPFVANSGHGDKFASVEELTHSSRQGLHLNQHAIPSFERITAVPSEQDGYFMLNAYLLDFYMHGQVSALVKANGIRRGDIWYLLQDFDLVLMTIQGALEQLLTEASRDATDTSVDDIEVDEIDSGYGSRDPAEVDHDEEDRDPSAFKRPIGVSEADWRVYEVVSSVLKEFKEKFKAMWA